MLDIFFVISSPFLSILVIYFSIGTVKVMYLSVFSPKQVNCFLNFSASSYMIIIIRSIMKNYRNFFSYTIFQITCAMRSISILSCNDSDFYFCDTFHLSNIYFQIFLYRYSKFLNFHMIPFVNSFIFFLFKISYFIACSLKDSQNVFMESLPLYTSCLFSMLLNEYCRH